MTNPQHEALVEAVARAMRERALEEQAGDSMLFAEFGGWGDEDDFTALACTAITVITEAYSKDPKC